ncbi:MAG: class I SAM-dependent methyltransferase [Leeuwenhoekiella sp.]
MEDPPTHFPKYIIDHAVTTEEFALRRNSQFGYLETIPIPENLDRYYQSDDYISHTDSKKGLVNTFYQQAKNVMLRRKLKIVGQFVSGKNLLDIGAGTGDFLAYAKSKSWRITGVEPNTKARDLAKDKGLNLIESFSGLPKGHYNCITLWHVLEHIPNPKETLQTLHNLLSKNGVTFVAVPNYKSKDSQIYKSFWAAYDVPRHLYHFDKASIEKLAKATDFELIKIIPMPLDACYVSILSEKYKSSKISFAKGIINGLYSNLSALRTKEFSSQIYVLKKQ